MANTKNIFLLLVLLLVGCAEQCEGEEPYFPGGLFAVWEPLSTPIGTVIIHQGHDTFDGKINPPSNLVPVALRFRDAGFLVYGLEMPPMPHSCKSEDYFLDPVRDILEVTGPAYIVGLSGGGLTATLMAARDDRIIKAYSVAGDAPPDVWKGPLHYEYHSVNYRAEYEAAGSRLLHIYNFNDPCCFWPIQGDIGYPYVIDYTANGRHMVSMWAADFIIHDIEDD